jgi:hypothetical protein
MILSDVNALICAGQSGASQLVEVRQAATASAFFLSNAP